MEVDDQRLLPIRAQVERVNNSRRLRPLLRLHWAAFVTNATEQVGGDVLCVLDRVNCRAKLVWLVNII